MHTNSRNTHREAIGVGFCGKIICSSVNFYGAINAALGVIMLLNGGGKYHYHGISDDLVERAIMLENNF